MRITYRQLKTWGQQSANRSVLVASFTVASLTLIAKLVSMIKDLFVAHQFGVSAELDAFLLAFVLPSFAVNVFAGASQTSFVPTYIEVRVKHGDKAAQELLSAITARLLFILGLITALLAVGMPILLRIIAPNLDEKSLELCGSLYLLLLPTVIINGMAILWGAVLNADGRFALAALAPVAIPVAIMGFLLVLAARWGVHALALGMLVGFVAQSILLALSLRRRGISLVPRWGSATPAVRQVIRQYIPMVAGSILMSSTELVDQAMASPLGAGSVSALNYGIKLVSFLLGICALALGTAALPYFSGLVAQQNQDGLKRAYRLFALLIVIVALPLTALIVVSSDTIIRLVFERGAFMPEDTQLVAQIQACYVLQFPFYLLCILTGRLLSALKQNRVFVLGATLNLITNIAMNYILIQFLGVAGIALSTSIVYVVSFMYLFIMLRRYLQATQHTIKAEPQLREVAHAERGGSI